jgi:hypothetical protein
MEEVSISRVNAEWLAATANTKSEIYRILTFEGSLYLPP